MTTYDIKTNYPSTLNYSYLNPDVPEIRVLKLLPSSYFDSQIECRLVKISLYRKSESDKYEAVSYVWGDGRKQRQIIIDGHTVKVTRNVELMLHHFRRSPPEERTLWIDDLCINQADNNERNHQVQLMREIYSNSKNGLAWLLEYKLSNIGLSDDEQDEAVQQQMEKIEEGVKAWQDLQYQILRFIVQTAKQTVKEIDEELLEFYRFHIKTAGREGLHYGAVHQDQGVVRSTDVPAPRRMRHRADGELTGQALMPGDPHETWKIIQDLLSENSTELAALFNKPSIWRRVWTMQELVNAPLIRLTAGYCEVNLLFVSTLLRSEIIKSFVQKHPLGYTTVGAAFMMIAFGGVQNVDRQRAMVWEIDSFLRYRNFHLLKTPVKLWDVLDRFDRNEASDPKDYIYGLLGLVTEECDIKVDYNKKLFQVFMDATIYMINSSQNLDTLCQLTSEPLHPEPLDNDGSLRETNSNIESLPSWVPDFSLRPSYGQKVGVLFAGVAGQIYAAGRERISSCRANIIDGALLQVQIIKLGSLLNDEACEYPNDDRWEFARRLPCIWLSEYEDGFGILDDDVRYDCTRESAFQAYWRTLLMDCKAEITERLTPRDMEAADVPFWEILRHGQRALEAGDVLDQSDSVLESLWGKLPKRLEHQWYQNYKWWKFAITDTGLYAMVHKVKADDVIVVADGAKVPLVLRPEGKHKGSNVYSLVGTAYVHGYMNGEAVEAVARGEMEEETVLLR